MAIAMGCSAMYTAVVEQYSADTALPWEVIGSIAGIAAFLLWYFIMRRIGESLEDEVYSKRLNPAFYLMIAGSVLSFLGTLASAEWLETIAGIVSLAGGIFYFMLIARCVKAGDAQVKKFGKLLIWTLIGCAVIMIVSAAIALDMGVHGGFAFFILGFGAAYCYVYPLLYALKQLRELEVA